jgi:two-component system, OmpR family, sensor kinase
MVTTTTVGRTTAMTEPDARPSVTSRLIGDVRLRILASYVILLALALLVSVLVTRQILIVRADDRIEDEINQELGEFRTLARGNDPVTGRPFGPDVDRIFEVFLDRNVPDNSEKLLTVTREGRLRLDPGEEAQTRIDPETVDRWRRLQEAERGELETAAGTVRYAAVPVHSDDRTLGTFVDIFFVEPERAEVSDVARIETAVGIVVLALGTLAAFFAAGRVLAPLRELRDAARAVSGTNLRRRIQVEGSDDIAELGRTFNRMLDRLELAFSSQRGFIRDISHELRTPVAVIRGHIELMEEGRFEDEGERRAVLALIGGELDRLSRFVDDLLVLARSERPDFLQLETIAVDKFIEELVGNAQALARRPWKLDADSRRTIVADHQRITQAMMNLTRNAVEHTSEGDEIEIGGSVRGDTAVLWVRDAGDGIAPEDQSRIFERFARGSRDGRRYEGSGLGLAIVKAIAEAHGGRVTVRSRPGVGSAFTILLPVDGPDQTTTEEERA